MISLPDNAPLSAHLILEDPNLEAEVRHELSRLRGRADRPCHGRFDSSSEVCFRCRCNTECAAERGHPLLIALVEWVPQKGPGIAIRLSARRM